MHRIDLPEWAVERGRRMNRFDAIDAARTALLVVDMQKAFTVAGEVFANPHARDIVPNINQLTSAMRRAGGLVVWTRQTITDDPRYRHSAWHYDESNPSVRKAMDALRAGTGSHELNDALDRQPGDIVIDKYRYSAFIQDASEIDAILRARGVDMLVIAGTLTNVCCESSARDAYMLGYRILFASDATAAQTDAEHNASLLNLCLNFADVRATDELVGLIQSSRTK